MRFVLSLGLAAVAFVLMNPAPSHADPYRWCAQYGLSDDAGRNCGFVTWNQCMAAISGVGGTCEPNPFYTGPRPYDANR
jgi:hypothetical protein